MFLVPDSVPSYPPLGTAQHCVNVKKHLRHIFYFADKKLPLGSERFRPIWRLQRLMWLLNSKIEAYSFLFTGSIHLHVHCALLEPLLLLFK